MNFIKKIFRILPVIIVVVCSLPLCASPLDSAVEAYEKGDFTKAACNFLLAIDPENPTPEAYYNLALAEKQSGQFGPATLSLRRALALNPRFDDARIMLSDIERSQGVPLTSNDWSARLSSRVPLFPLAAIGFIAFWFGLAVLLLVKVALWRFPAALILFAGALLFSVAIFVDPRFAWRGQAVVTAEGEVAFSQTPSETATPISKLPPATLLTIIRDENTWCYCRLPDGRAGWITRAAISNVLP